MLGEGRQIFEYRGARRQAALVEGLPAAAGEHEHRARAGGRGRLHVAQRVTHHVGVLGGNVEAPRHLEQHAGLGLAALARRVDRVRAEEERVDAPARLRRGALQRVVNGNQRRRVEQPKPLVREAGRRFNADMQGLPVIGDGLRDLQAAESVGSQPMLVLTGKGERTLREGDFPASTVIFPDLAFAVSALLANR